MSENKTGPRPENQQTQGPSGSIDNQYKGIGIGAVAAAAAALKSGKHPKPADEGQWA